VTSPYHTIPCVFYLQEAVLKCSVPGGLPGKGEYGSSDAANAKTAGQCACRLLSEGHAAGGSSGSTGEEKIFFG
jgi:hypothetical protein